MALAGSLGLAQTTQVNNTNTRANEIKATDLTSNRTSRKIINEVGGIPLVTYHPNYGLSPKEYGMRFGNGNYRKVKHNRLRYSHNAKLKRRA